MKPFINPITGLQIGSEQKTTLLQDLSSAMKLLSAKSTIGMQDAQAELLKQGIIKEAKMNKMREGLPDNFYETLMTNLGIDMSTHPEKEDVDQDILSEQLKIIRGRISSDYMKPGWQDPFQLFK